MSTLSVNGLGTALGTAGALAYVGCVVLMLVLPQDATIWFFNSLLHGWDVAPVMRWSVPWWQIVIGIVETFALGWLLGAVIAVVYNAAAGGRSRG